METALPRPETPSFDAGAVLTASDAQEGVSRPSIESGKDVSAPVPRSNSGPALEGLDTVDQPRRSGKSTTRNNRYTLDWAYADECLESMQVCGLTGKVFTHKWCDARILVENRCDERACAKCSPRRIRRLRRRYELTIRKFEKPGLFTLTVPNVHQAGELPGAMESLTKGFENLRRSVAWPRCGTHDSHTVEAADRQAKKAAKKKLLAECYPRCWGVWSLEITWSTAKGYHPHLHCIVDFPWMDNWKEGMGAITATWEQLTGAKVEPDLKRPHNAEEKEGLIREGMKYVTKQWELEDAPLKAILAVTGKRKMFHPFGGLEMEEDQDADSGACCPKCHNAIQREWEWFENTSVDEEGLKELRASKDFQSFYTGWYFPDQEKRPAAEPIGFSQEPVAAA